MSEKRKVTYWDREDQENLTHEDFDEAVESILDGMCLPLPAKLQMCGYARLEIGDLNILEELLDNLDVEYSDREGDPTEPTKAMVEAAESLESIIERDYHVWACEIVERREVDVAEWVRANRPDWLADTTIQTRRKTG